MKKFLTLLALVGFMCGAVYLLLNERNFLKSSKKVAKKNLVVSKSKIIGEKNNHTYTPNELQRMRIDSESVFRFENEKTEEAYELDEFQLVDFAKQLNSIKSINQLDDNQLPPTDVSEEKEKEYFTE